jgi:hypothetical protein
MDVHVHLRGAVEVGKDGLIEGEHDNRRAIQALQGYLYSGVTTIYDVGNVPDFIYGCASASGPATSSRRAFSRPAAS